jgi:hypothetical protein
VFPIHNLIYYRMEASITKTKWVIIGILGLAAVALAYLGWLLLPLSLAPKATVPSEKLAQLAKDGLAKNSLADFIELRTVDITDTTAVIDYGTTDLVSNDESVVAPFMQNLGNIIPQVFREFPTVNALALYQITRLRDAYGNISEGIVIRLVISRATSARIDWKNFKPKNLPGVLNDKGDSLQVHPAIDDGWAAYLQKD